MSHENKRLGVMKQTPSPMIYALGSAVIALMLISQGASANQIIRLASGDLDASVIGGDPVGPGSLDPNITMLIGPANSPIPTFTPAQFQSAQTGPNAYVVNNHPRWNASLSTNPDANWIATSPTGSAGNGNSALFAIPFQITDPTLVSATLEMRYVVDNHIGDASNEGLFLNGVGVSGTKTGILGSTAFNFENEQFVFVANIHSLLNFGDNTLYVNLADLGGSGGIMFDAVIRTTSATSSVIPGPGVVPLFGLGLLTFWVWGRKHRAWWSRSA